jgi:NADH:ubiquinone oxidoreductase subunit C
MTGLPQDLAANLLAAAPAGVDLSSSTNAHGVTVSWCSLANSEELVPVGQLLVKLGARMTMITAFQPPAPSEDEKAEDESAPKEAPKTFGGTPLDGTSYEIDYHFELNGDTLTIIVYIPAGGSIPSLTPLFRAADWHEREMMELYNIVVRDHPDPRRLFIDPSIDGAVLERLIPYSTLVNAASTKSLWDRVMAGRGSTE